jgi:hypothetical protein
MLGKAGIVRTVEYDPSPIVFKYVKSSGPRLRMSTLPAVFPVVLGVEVGAAGLLALRCWMAISGSTFAKQSMEVCKPAEAHLPPVHVLVRVVLLLSGQAQRSSVRGAL